MNQSPDETRIHELMQRLKQADKQDVPTFEDVLSGGDSTRQVERWRTRNSTRWVKLLGTACCTAVAVLVAFFFVWSRPDELIVKPNPQLVGADAASVSDIDFDHLRFVVEEHFIRKKRAHEVRVPVWSSRTESLLALNLEVSWEQE